MKHVDDWLDEPSQNDGEELAKVFLEEARRPACEVDREWMNNNPLYCQWRGQNYRCTGASRLGDVWLAKDFSRQRGYDHRVDIAECDFWSDRHPEEE